MRQKRNCFYIIVCVVLIFCSGIVAYAASTNTTWYKNGSAKLHGKLETVSSTLYADEARAKVQYVGEYAADVKVQLKLLKNGVAEKTTAWIVEPEAISTGWISQRGMTSAKGYYNCDEGGGNVFSPNKTLTKDF